MKKLLITLLIAVFGFALVGCGEDGPPQVRVKNESTGVLSIGWDTTGNTVNENGIDAGYYSAWRTVTPGVVTWDINGNNQTTFTAVNGKNYTCVAISTTVGRLDTEDQ